MRSLRVGLVGCSGTGSIVFELLLRNGVGSLVLVDPDLVEEKNLNRIPNSRMADAQSGIPKVEMLRQRAEEIGLGTRISAYVTDILDPSASRAIGDCDLVFGCMDSVEGRHVLNMLAAAYLLPYFDLGVHIQPDGAGGITHAVAAAHYLTPGDDLLSRGVYTPDQLTAEAYRRTDPEYYEQNREAGYLTTVGEDQPAVISLNMQAATMAVNDLLARVHGFRLDDDSEFAVQRFHLTRGYYEHRAAGDCSGVFRKWVGVGDEILNHLGQYSALRETA